MKTGLQKKKVNYGWLFISPFLVGFVFVYLRVFVSSVIISFNDIQLSDSGFLNPVGWANFREVLFVNTSFNKTVVTSITKMLVNVPVIIIISLFLAVLLNQKMRGRAAFRTIFFLPVILTTGIIAEAEMNNTIIREMWNTSGIETGGAIQGGAALISSLDVQKYLDSLHIGSQFTDYILGAVNNIYNILNISGVQLLIFLAGLQSISPSIYESAYIEGATGWEAFWKITFPIISPLILLNLVYSIIDSFTNPFNELILLIHKVGISQGKAGIASAMAWVYTAVTTVIILIVLFFASRIISSGKSAKGGA